MSVVGPDGTSWPEGSLRAIEHQSIRDFVAMAAGRGYLSGRVLDYGCGKQPYRDLVDMAGGHYEGYDLAEFPANVSGEDIGTDLMWDANAWDTILCTQVIQYVFLEYVSALLDEFRDRLFDGGHLVMTYPTNWPEVEPWDLHRFTRAGMEKLLLEAGFEIVLHERRAETVNRDGTWALGYGVIAKRKQTIG